MQRPSHFSSICKRLALLCNLVFISLIAWSIVAVGLMAYSTFQSDFPTAITPLAVTVLVLYALYSANSCLLPLIFGKMLKDISKSRTPFTLNNAKLLKDLALILLIYAALETLLAAVGAQLEFTIDNNSIQVGSMIRDFLSNSGTTLNLFPLLMSAMFFALSYVFKYGVLLQQESDETL